MGKVTKQTASLRSHSSRLRVVTIVFDLCLGTAPQKTDVKGVNIDITKDTKTTKTTTTTTTTKDTVKRVDSDSGSAGGRKTGGTKGRCFWQ